MDGREYIAKLALVLVTMPNDTSELLLTDHLGSPWTPAFHCRVQLSVSRTCHDMGGFERFVKVGGGVKAIREIQSDETSY